MLSDLDAEEGEHGPHDPDHGDRAGRPAPVPLDDAGQAQDGEGGQGQHGQDEHYGRDHYEDGVAAADRVGEQALGRAEVRPVDDGLERPAEGGDEPSVEHLPDEQDPEQAAGGQGHRACGPAGQGEHEGHQQDALERDPQQGSRGESFEVVRRDQREPHEGAGRGGEHSGRRPAPRRSPGPDRGDAGAVLDQRQAGRAEAPQPPRLVRERLDQQGQRDADRDLGGQLRQHVGGRDREHDALRGRHRLAPVARRHRLLQPRQRPAGGDEQVAGRADDQHPGAGRPRDVDAEHEDEERVDLHVEARAQRPGRRGPAGHPAVDAVEGERDGREREHGRHRDRPHEGVRDQCGNTQRERDPDQRHPVGRPQPVGAVVRERARQHDGRDRGARDAERPAVRPQPDRAVEHRQQRDLGEQAEQRATLNRAHDRLR